MRRRVYPIELPSVAAWADANFSQRVRTEWLAWLLDACLYMITERPLMNRDDHSPSQGVISALENLFDRA